MSTPPNHIVKAPEKLYPLRELERMGYGSRKTLQRRIAGGLMPAVMVGNRYMIRASELHLIAVPVNPELSGSSH